MAVVVAGVVRAKGARHRRRRRGPPGSAGPVFKTDHAGRSAGSTRRTIPGLHGREASHNRNRARGQHREPRRLASSRDGGRVVDRRSNEQDGETVMGSFDYDVVIVGSGFGGSVAALRAAGKGYRVGVMEAGRRWTDEDIPKMQWNLPRFLWFPAAAFKYEPDRDEYGAALRGREPRKPPTWTCARRTGCEEPDGEHGAHAEGGRARARARDGADAHVRVLLRRRIARPHAPPRAGGRRRPALGSGAAQPPAR